jgi:predicted enzyme related to lactoylglutathione lyase
VGRTLAACTSTQATGSEVEALRDFYRDTFAMEVVSEEEGESVWFAMRDMTFGFHVGDPIPREHRWCVNIVLNTADGVSIDDEAKRLEAAGLSLMMGPTDMPWGARVVTLLDPAGYAVWYMQRSESLPN